MLTNTAPHEFLHAFLLFKYSPFSSSSSSFSFSSNLLLLLLLLFMDPKLCLFSSFFFFFFFFSEALLQTYIVQLEPNLDPLITNKLEWHLSLLQQASTPSRLLYSYEAAIEGFAARLTEEEAEAMRSIAGVVSVRLDRGFQLHTTYSHKFLGLSFSGNGAWSESGFGEGTVVGVLDTGVWPESPSFDDRGMPPVPKKWRGVCQEGEDFNSSHCNRKLVGARYYAKGHHASNPASSSSVTEYISPRDAHGHGTHTSSTVTGVAVPGASVLGLGLGTASGMAPRAHLAIYKVCWFSGCYSSDILAGMDDAIKDGVDVLSLSLGGFPIPLFEDSIAIGSYRATASGISVICAGGNNGPVASSVANEAPWITTVGAGTLDRRFPAVVKMGNGELLYGESMFPGNRYSKNGGKEVELELVYENGGNDGGESCYKGSLTRAQVAGKLVVCDRGGSGRAEKGEVVKEAGGAAMILTNTEVNLEEDSVDVHVLPATLVGYNEAIQLKKYINATAHPVAKLVFGGSSVGRSRAPAVALFSSRGPSLTNPSILKPDIIAPGVNIIAAWPENLGPSGLPEDVRRSNFSVLSGTSMACPHVSGITALIRAKHPTWSPAMIKSAIMTSADITDHYGKPILDGVKPAGIFAIGAGHVNPAKAIDPGLVYDISPDEYVIHLCSLGYTRSEIFGITHKNSSCKETLQRNKHFSLNYPSISVTFKHGRTRVVVQRRVTNVGAPNSVYTVQVTTPRGVRMRVVPEILTFTQVNQVRSYSILFESTKRVMKGNSYAEGSLVWIQNKNGSHRVRSPLSITWAGDEAEG
ncbi:LOW QUALITY PROTEIN: subtilisin-like protease SBT1.2 [Dioscorea cayenensis subsp. rotundata]|uniref:LOW QUALITY PROTEIN: subtilisin-like protease SBT1.2 n=1 Tax=Dioscorea cayennensis subsp. rotundata TaxID=55577 RepID=A0AB40CTL8_DIOCR|nr:LOW QUALITY PROTEIN: subtilisin-like protease SBT1.2 [Dioscorea cayenensis subsp. rotundata]